VLSDDEVDRADEAFEAYLLELLSDFQLRFRSWAPCRRPAGRWW
jgi:MoxR-like ATPase